MTSTYDSNYKQMLEPDAQPSDYRKSKIQFSEEDTAIEMEDLERQASLEGKRPSLDAGEAEEGAEAHAKKLTRRKSYFPANPYWETSTWQVVSDRLPWLLALMMIQSTSGYILENYKNLIQKHFVIASFLTMLVGGGGNSSGQVVAELIMRMSRKQVTPEQWAMVLFKELCNGFVLASILGAFAYLRVIYLSNVEATHMDGLAIALSYFLIVNSGIAVGVLVTTFLYSVQMASVGAPPVTQVLVDVLGTVITMTVCSALLISYDNFLDPGVESMSGNWTET